MGLKLQDIGEGESVYENDSVRILVRPDIEGWMVECDRLEFRFLAATRPELDGPIEFLAHHAEEISRLQARDTCSLTRDVGHGLLADVARMPGGFFRVELRKNGGVRVGTYEGFINRSLSSFVLGQATIQGAEMLADRYRGLRLGDAMRDLAEEIMGVPAVPHGRNFAPGGLSDAAARSWSRRARERHVPGITPDLAVNIRRRLAEWSQERIEHRSWMASLPVAVAISDRAGFDLVVVSADSRPMFAWSVAPSGLPISVTGITSERRTFEEARRRILLGGDPRDTVITLDRIPASAGRDLIADSGKIHEVELGFVDRMMKIIQAGRLPSPPISSAALSISDTAQARVTSLRSPT